MLVISKFKDYYDGAAESGIDKTIIYKRETIVYDKKNIDLIDNDSTINNVKPLIVGGWSNLYGNNNNHSETTKQLLLLSKLNLTTVSSKSKNKDKADDVIPIVISFCGKIIICWKIACFDDNGGVVLSFEYDTEKVLKENDIRFFGFFNEKNNKPEHVVNNVIKHVDLTPVHRYYNTPVIMLDYNIKPTKRDYVSSATNKILVINPVLNDIEFYKVKDTFNCFKSIEGYITGVLGSDNGNIIELSNESKIVKHGFDLKTSFRKEPGGKKRKRKHKKI